MRYLADPVFLARILSTQVNSQNDDGVLGTGGDLETKIWKSQNCDFFSVF